MNKILMIVRREYLQTVKAKAFWIGTLIFPVIMGMMFVIPLGLSRLNPERQKTIAFVDETGKLVQPVREQLADEQLDDGRPEFIIEELPVEGGVAATRKAAEARVLNGSLYGVVSIDDRLDSEKSFRFDRKNVGDIQTERTVARALREAVVGLRLERSALALSQDDLKQLTRPIDLESYQVSESGEARKKGFIESYFATYMFVLVLYFMLYFYGFAVTRGVLQEKTSRVMEVLLGSVSPQQLMTGKILGIGLAGLTQMGIYLVTIGAARVAILSLALFDDPGALLDAVAPYKLAFFAIYFVLGYFLFVTFFAMIGSICNSEQEAQNFQLPIVMALVIPMVSTIFFVQHPDATAATVLSLVPIFTPMLMFMRVTVLSPPAWQIVLSIVLMLVSIWFLFNVAARIFRVGTLMYGKRPSLSEVARWVRSSAH